MDTADASMSPGASLERPTSPDPDTLPPLWHEDGNIILVVMANDKTYRFRVHTLVLSLQSPVFKDMIRLEKNPPAVGADCPSVTLHDPVEDVRVFLNALYQGLGLFRNPDALTFDGALGLLRLAHKYQSYVLLEGVIQLLKESWPINRSDYTSGNPAGRARILKCIKLINAARQINASVLLPTAFYELAYSSFDAWDVDNITELLSPDDFLRLKKGKQNIIRRLATLCNVEASGKVPILWSANPKIKAGNIFSSSRKYCRGEENNSHRYNEGTYEYCASVFQTLAIRLGNQLLNGRPLLFALSQSMLMPKLKAEDMCNPCSLWVDELIKNKEKEIWHNVPVDFDLPPIDPAEYSRQDGPRRRF